tara:strand:+ start:2667 stop:2882 length:216 start_codon:yes stop_codon:yes gene_type:complete
MAHVDMKSQRTHMLYRGRRIRNWILSEGDFFDFERLATEDEDGCINMSQLADDECVLSPGVIYKKRNCPCV